MTFVLCRDQDELHVYGESSWLTWDLKESDQALNREVVLKFVQLNFGLEKFCSNAYALWYVGGKIN